MKFLGLSFILPCAVAVGYFLGVWLDGLLRIHFLYIVLLVLGAVGGFIALLREIRSSQS